MLQHTWAEIEHDLGYKSAEGLPKAIKRDFSRLAGLLELADKEFLSIRNYLTNYQDEVNKIIQSTEVETNILIDRITLKEFIKSSFFKEQAHFIAYETKLNINYLISDRDIDKLTSAFDFLSIFTINDLKQLLEQSKLLMVDSFNLIQNEEEYELVDRGILYYILYYKIIHDSMPKDTLKEIFNILSLTSNYEEDYEELLHSYNSAFDN